jgi:hypothetical protein
MQTHFDSFTPQWAQAFGQELAAELQRRREFLDNTRRHTLAFLADFRRAHRNAETERREGRRLFMSELRSGAHALHSRFQLARSEMAADLRQMASELHATSEAFRRRPGRQGGFFFRRSAPAATQPPPAATQPPPKEGEQAFGAGFEGQEGAKKPWHSKKSHG